MSSKQSKEKKGWWLSGIIYEIVHNWSKARSESTESTSEKKLGNLVPRLNMELVALLGKHAVTRCVRPEQTKVTMHGREEKMRWPPSSIDKLQL